MPAGLSILLADDHEDSATFLARLLETHGATVTVATSAEGVLAVVGDVAPALLILDIGFPGMSGYELLGELRKRPGLQRVPAIALTGHAFEEDRERSAAAGFDLHITKPVDGEALVHVIGRLMRKTLPPPTSPALVELRRVVTEGGLESTLRWLNARTQHRYAAIYRFDGSRLHNLHLIDRHGASARAGADSELGTTYCARVATTRRAFVTTDAMQDDRLEGHPSRHALRAYCGALLRNPDGTPYGTLCLFDEEARPVSTQDLLLVEEAAEIVSEQLLPT